ncbi:sulfite exporter TauE/SafE family protein [Haloarcula onubensis]|uniref:Sulfite exporter TauE/SafE family protein n=1 Tax=Haloarcula onubensis TaxID=2950539 RepID=A0ABU2FJH3_9EURY|nr:sulfite exporter TauE/SafE family protein [Halomicroarcula sp. S3CR25-11]MDS0280898.1 sulfite exporter TauE/SafE family protein [Halomicroarcula sp. S3CR25-11]
MAPVTGLSAGETTGLAAMVGLGLVGSVHCLGMCGPLVTTYADRLDDGGPLSLAEIRQQTLFNVGRTGSYTLLGGLFGAAGALVYDLAALARVGDVVRGGVGVAVGLCILAVGVGYLTRGRAVDLGRSLPLVGDLFARLSSAMVARLDRLVDGPGMVALGAMHGLLPCPLLYPAFLYAATTGSAVTGALSLAALGLGTVPLVFAAGTAFGSLSTRRRATLHRVMGAVFLLLALVPLANGLAAFGVALPKPPLPMPWT